MVAPMLGVAIAPPFTPAHWAGPLDFWRRHHHIHTLIDQVLHSPSARARDARLQTTPAPCTRLGRPNTFFSCKTKLPRSRPSACRGFRNRFVLEETAEVKRWRVPMARDRSRESVHERYWSPSRAAVARHTAQLGHSRACRSKARLTGRNMRSLQPFGASGTG